MATEPPRRPCPCCGESIAATAVKCRFCGEFVGDEADRAAVERKRADEFEATDLLIPRNVSPWAIGACYMGLVGFCLPFVGLLFAIPGLIFGIMALRRRPQTAGYGSTTSNLRAIIGIVLSSLAILGWSGLLLFLILNGPNR